MGNLGGNMGNAMNLDRKAKNVRNKGNGVGMRGIWMTMSAIVVGMQQIWVGMQGIEVGMQEIWVGMQGIESK